MSGKEIATSLKNVQRQGGTIEGVTHFKLNVMPIQDAYNCVDAMSMVDFVMPSFQD